MHGCPTCDMSFDTSHGMKVHHVMVHDESLAKKQCTCKNCGKGFEEFQSRIENGRGEFCSKECAYDHGRVAVECVRCGEEIKRPEHRAGRYEQEYCSRQCYQAEKMESPHKTAGWIDGRTYRPGYNTRYNKRFNENRAVALQRDEKQCQVCGMTSKQHRSEYDMDLHVHHIQPVSSFDEPGNAHSLENLITLCLPHHRKWEGIPLKPEVQNA